MKKINIIDIAVVLLIIALIVVAFLKFGMYSGAKNESEMNKIEYTLRISGVRMYTVDAFKVGDVIYDSQTKLAIGTITDIQTSKAKNIEETSDGRLVNAENVDKYELLITVQGDGMETDKAYFADRSVELKVGSEKVVETLYVKATCMIMSIKSI